MADIKFTVVYDKSVARLELPPTATLAALAELLADRFSEAQPKAIELKLPDAEASLRLLDFPEATLDSAGGDWESCQPLNGSAGRLRNSPSQTSQMDWTPLQADFLTGLQV